MDLSSGQPMGYLFSLVTTFLKSVVANFFHVKKMKITHTLSLPVTTALGWGGRWQGAEVYFDSHAFHVNLRYFWKQWCEQ